MTKLHLSLSVEPIAAALCAGLLLYAARVGWRWLAARRRTAELLARAQEKKAQRESQWPDAQFGPFSDEKHGMAIVSLTATELADAIRNKKYTSEEVVRAYCCRAKEVGKQLNMTAEACFEDAMREAKLCDRELKAGKLRGPLHGVPFSVKDQFDMKGYDSTCGLAARVFKPLERTSVLVTMLQAAGGIPFVRSNIPQCLMLPESFNAIWGTAQNPFDRTRTVGGSSGGEGGLLAAHASPIGIGTDIGGSIRIPAAFCGVVGFKPTPQRMTKHGCAVPRPKGASGQNAIAATAGPLARSVADCDLAMSIWCADHPETAADRRAGNFKTMWSSDADCPRVPWNQDESSNTTKKLKFAVIKTDGFFEPAPSYSRALDTASRGLRQSGHTVVDLAWPGMNQCALLYVALLGAEGSMQGFVDGLEGEALHPNYSFLKTIASLPGFVRTVMSCTMGLLGQSRMASLVRAGAKKDTYTFWGFVKERNLLRESLIKFLQSNEIDAVLSPGMGMPAFKHGGSVKLNQSCSYTTAWNLFNFPAGIVPVTYVAEGEDFYRRDHKDQLDAAAEKDIRGSVGMPVTVQVAAVPWKDELCMCAMRHVEKAVSSSWKPPLFTAASVDVSAPQ